MNPHLPIEVLQEDPHAQRLLAAQARMYSDAKTMHHGRLIVVWIVAVLAVASALLFPDARVVIGLIGGVAGFVWSLLGSAREKRSVREAASVQEEFDTYVFGLPWNNMAVDRVDPTRIAIAAGRYRGNRTHGWYPPTAAVERPLDVLICQRSNLGWAAALHRALAAGFAGLLVLVVVGAGLVAALAGLTFTEVLAALVVPLLGPARELVDLVGANRASETTKRKMEAKVSSLWHDAVTRSVAVQVADCRAVQDRVYEIRLSNAHVPDWLDDRWRSRNETAMRGTADHLIEEAVDAGFARKPGLSGS